MTVQVYVLFIYIGYTCITGKFRKLPYSDTSRDRNSVHVYVCNVHVYLNVLTLSKLRT